MARCSARVRCAQDHLQPVRSLEPSWRVQQDFRRAGAQGWQASAADDRYNPFESPSHRREPFKKGPVPRRIGRTKGGLNSKLHAVCDGQGRPLIMLLSEGQMSDYKGAALMFAVLPNAKELLDDKGYDADWFRTALAERGITACIPSKSNRKAPIEHTAHFTASVTRLRICSESSRTGDAFIPATIDAHIRSCQQSVSQHSSSSGSDQ